MAARAWAGGVHFQPEDGEQILEILAHPHQDRQDTIPRKPLHMAAHMRHLCSHQMHGSIPCSNWANRQSHKSDHFLKLN